MCIKQILQTSLSDTISGAAYKSRSDPHTHVSGQIFGASGRLTSVHAYEDGSVEYSQRKYNDAQN